MNFKKLEHLKGTKNGHWAVASLTVFPNLWPSSVSDTENHMYGETSGTLNEIKIICWSSCFKKNYFGLILSVN